ncbi:hypothetical protein, partial [Okeania sp. SIO2B9]|uniref:hypothetical protein n=1 Tax=Okeania sp. SIO2B9 TaxID=2607782 RepID=UPI00257DC525
SNQLSHINYQLFPLLGGGGARGGFPTAYSKAAYSLFWRRCLLPNHPGYRQKSGNKLYPISLVIIS